MLILASLGEDLQIFSEFSKLVLQTVCSQDYQFYSAPQSLHSVFSNNTVCSYKTSILPLKQHRRFKEVHWFMGTKISLSKVSN